MYHFVFVICIALLSDAPCQSGNSIIESDQLYPDMQTCLAVADDYWERLKRRPGWEHIGLGYVCSNGEVSHAQAAIQTNRSKAR